MGHVMIPTRLSLCKRAVNKPSTCRQAYFLINQNQDMDAFPITKFKYQGTWLEKILAAEEQPETKS